MRAIATAAVRIGNGRVNEGLTKLRCIGKQVERAMNSNGRIHDDRRINTELEESSQTIGVDSLVKHELFTDSQRAEAGIGAAQNHLLKKDNSYNTALLTRLADNDEVIRRVHRELVDDVTEKKTVTSVGEWLVDNYYVIEEQINLASRHLPKKYLIELPQLANPGKEGVPRAYDLAELIIAAGDGRVDIGDVEVIVSAYQEGLFLTLGELWAIPIMLRLALIENIRHIAILIEQCREDRDCAAYWADFIIRMGEEEPKNIVLAVADMARAKLDLSNAFVAEFRRKLHARGGMALPLSWIEQNLNEKGVTVEEAVNGENRTQAVLEISMRNSINSLRSLNLTDWRKFVENLSQVEKILRRDPAELYERMDFDTRDEYRRQVEAISRKSRFNEIEVASKCLELAQAAARKGSDDDVPAHVGYYLIGPGDRLLKQHAAFDGDLGDFIRDASARQTLALYLGSISILTAVLTVLATLLTRSRGVDGWLLAWLSFLFAVCSCHLSIGIVNLVSTILVKPRILPRLNFETGIPEDKRTLVVVPVIISGQEQVAGLFRNLERHYLGNRGQNIHFGLLTDFADAPQMAMSGDDQLLALCRRETLRLNKKYPGDGGDNFFLFHRARQWNPVEKVWMGHERKRGKLADLNRYLQSGDSSLFACIVGRESSLKNVRYVITLDADTILPREAARRLAGAMAHPLAGPVYDERLGRVVRGHGILQPRVDSLLSGADKSLYARMSASEIGIDPYTRASSDVYQDLFDEGSFIGKGIYDAALFDKALGGRFSDNKILSHDLLEGCVVRSGLVNDIKLYEDPPATYLMDIARRHRWVRGDWQIASYLLAGETRRGFKETINPLNKLSQWKVFDNLRRSLTPIGILLLLLLGLALLQHPGTYVLVVSCVFVVPILVNALSGLIRKSPDKTLKQHFSNLFASVWRQAGQALFRFSCLPFESYVNADAVIRSLWRQCVSKRLLLQWKPSHNAFDAASTRFLPILRRMWIGPALAVVMTAVLKWENREILYYALPLFMLWLLSPLLACWLSKPRRPAKETLEPGQVRFLRQSARRIWLFFEDFVGADDNWLPPDNYQEYPESKVAHRTSPTNMGLALLANLTAFDFGFASQGRMLSRCQNSLKSMANLKRYRGHFYNWYDTKTLEILKPAYVSTVDSGNLAAHMRVLASGLREMQSGRIVSANQIEGLLDAASLACEEARKANLPLEEKLSAFTDRLAGLSESPLCSYREIFAAMETLSKEAEELSALCPGDAAPEVHAVRRWLDALLLQCDDVKREYAVLMPWLPQLRQHPEWENHIRDLAAPSLQELRSLPDALNHRGDEQLHAVSSGQAQAGQPILPEELQTLLETGAANAEMRLETIQDLLIQCEDVSNLEYDFLYSEETRLLSIGFNVDEHRLDAGYYDLLASEARLATYLGIVQNQLPQASWFALGRMLALAGRHPLLVSWSGSMFEYLMPLLVMPTYDDTLLDETYKAVINAQIEYGEDKNVPWGISESGYNAVDSEQNYQYRAFGVPELGLKHDISDDLVIAPYAAALAVMVYPKRACENLEDMAKKGWQSLYGFYEAVDFTPSRLKRGDDFAMVRSFMAHHQGMSLAAFGQALLGNPMHRRFVADPLLGSATLLLQEMAPTERALYFHSTYTPEIKPHGEVEESPMRILENPNAQHPEIQLLSNGRYSVMVTTAGGGYSRWRDLSLTRWREDPTRDNWGTFCYVRDRDIGEVWSAAYQPLGKRARGFETVFTEGKAEFTRRESHFEIRTEITVSPEDDVEVREIKITNRGQKRKEFDFTTYAEVVLAQAAADDSHQAFSKLFVESKILRSHQAVLCARRPRRQDEKIPVMFHMLALHGAAAEAVSYETDRLRFIGRGRDASNPVALFGDAETLPDSEGAVLDPIIAIQVRTALDPGESLVFDFVAGVGSGEEDVLAIIEKYADRRVVEKAFDLAWSTGQLLLRQQNISETDAQLYCQLASSIVYADPAMRAAPSILAQNTQGQSRLWGYSISGDLPIVLVKIEDAARLKLVDQLIQAHAYWRAKGLAVDLVVWNEDQTGYRQPLHDQITGMAVAALGEGNIERPGGIFIRTFDRVSEEDRILIQSVARVVLSDNVGSLEDQLRRLSRKEITSSTTIIQYKTPQAAGTSDAVRPLKCPDLQFDNGFGGFSADGREYIVTHEAKTPLPWINVIASENFGTMVSESGSACTWSENSHEYRLTPWYNDPVEDPSGEIVYIRDDYSGDYWTPTPLPCRGPG